MMETSLEAAERLDFGTAERPADDDVLLRALLELAASAERNRARSRTDADRDGPLPEAA